MIYLFDEKTDRRTDYGWSDKKIEICGDILRSFASYDFITSCDTKSFGDDCDIALIHESFFQGVGPDLKEAANIIRHKIYSDSKNGEMRLVIFAGSKSSRKIEDFCAFMPVSVFYQNLSFFTEKYRTGDWDLEDIVYGKNSLLEKDLLKRIENANTQMVNDDLKYSWPSEKAFPRTILIKSEDENSIDPPSFYQEGTKTLYYNMEETEPVSDRLLHGFVREELTQQPYDKILIPLCFGPTLSDFNGLRLALHIRTTQGVNQYSSIYIYSPIGIDAIIGNEFFDIIKTSNVFYVDYSCQGIYNALLNTTNDSPDNIRRSLSLVNLTPPKNYVDSHSIANEWAINRWAQCINGDVEDDGIKEITENIEHNVYFKYLNTIHPVKSLSKLERYLEIKHDKAKRTPRILLVDDEADKGWYEIFCNILYDRNGFDFLYIDNELDGKTQSQIVNIVKKKIIKEDIDIVLLDYRLVLSDFSETSPGQKTGMMILKEIKQKINPGIQVIIISATNKVWNLQAMQEVGLDGFVLKESPSYNLDSDITENNIRSFISSMSKSINNGFKKDLYNSCVKTLDNLNRYTLEKEEVEFEKLVRYFSKQIELIKGSVQKIDYYDNSTLDITFINCFNIFEVIKDNYYYNGDMFKIDKENGRYIYRRMYSGSQPSIFDIIGSMIFSFEKNNESRDKMVEKFEKLKRWRNNFIHGTKKHFSVMELMQMIDFCNEFSKKLRSW